MTGSAGFGASPRSAERGPTALHLGFAPAMLQGPGDTGDQGIGCWPHAGPGVPASPRGCCLQSPMLLSPSPLSHHPGPLAAGLERPWGSGGDMEAEKGVPGRLVWREGHQGAWAHTGTSSVSPEPAVLVLPAKPAEVTDVLTKPRRQAQVAEARGGANCRALVALTPHRWGFSPQ